MQDCFRKYPDVYGSELADDEEEEGTAPAPEPSEALAKSAESQRSASAPQPPAPREEGAPTTRKEAAKPVEGKEAEQGLPKKAIDATDADRVQGQ